MAHPGEASNSNGHVAASNSRKRPRIGVFVEWVADGYTDPIVDEIVAVAREHKVDVLCFVGGLEPADVPNVRANKPLKYACPDNIDAVLLVAIGNYVTTTQIAAEFKRFEALPMVSVAVHWDEYPQVTVDNETGVRAGVRHLIRTHKCRNIACIRGPEASSEAQERYRAFRETLAEHGIEHNPELEAVGYFYNPHGADAVRLWLDERKVSFDAVIAANDGMAIAAMSELERRGIRVPEDVAVFGFDDAEYAMYQRPPLTTVRQPIREQARKAFDVLLTQLGGETIPKITRIGSQLVVRRSCGCIAFTGEASSFPPRSGSGYPVDSLEDWAMTTVSSLSTFGRISEASERLLARTFLEALTTVHRMPFLRAFESLLEQASQQHIDVLGAFQPLNDLRKRAQRRLSDSQREDRLDKLLNDAGTLIAEVAARTQAARRYGDEQLFRSLVQTNDALLSATDLNGLRDALAKSLDAFGVSSCFMCTVDANADLKSSSTLRMAYIKGSELDLPEGGQTFPVRDILPAPLLDSDSPKAWLVMPLLRSHTIAGYAVIERGVPDGFVYDGLIEQLGSAYLRIMLLNQVVQEVERRELAERERLEKEMQIATTIQTGILPKNLQVEGLQIAAVMVPAAEVGGDYYDVIRTNAGCWIGIGDVAGHGLPTGLMMMMQSAIGSLVRNHPGASPQSILPAADRLLYDNIRQRIGHDEHITLTLIRHDQQGQLTFAGAHEDILICRADTGDVERIGTPGVWTAAIEDIEGINDESTCSLSEGDLMLLYTDGITEAMNSANEMFGVQRLAESLHQYRHEPVDTLRDSIMAEVRAWANRQDDDMTLLVARQC